MQEYGISLRLFVLSLIFFLKSVSYSFLYTGLLHPQVGLFLGILFFAAMANGIIALISF